LSESGSAVIGYIISFCLGLLTSGIIVLLYERGTRPLLKVLPADLSRAQFTNPSQTRGEFYHVKVQNQPAMWPLTSRRPAWSCKVTLEILDSVGNRTLAEPIIAKWASQPEPLLPGNDRGNIIRLFDPARLMAARKIDVYNHDDQHLSVAIKYEGQDDCYLFSNESYLYQDLMNPAWRLARGKYRLRVTVYYEREPSIQDFWLRNEGATLNDFILVPFK
jgi:hypothetical protein